jgi:two-component system OmpR family sensor kinase
LKLATRMWLLGAVLPAAGTALAVVAGGWVFRANLEREVDRALATQASSERVSLFDRSFDRPDGKPHIHVDPRGMAASTRLTDSMTLYGPDGAPFDWYPRGPHPPPNARVVPEREEGEPRFLTRALPGRRERVLRLTVSRIPGENYVLEIVAGLHNVDAAVRAFYRVSLGVALLITAVLFAVHGVHARRLATRVRRLADHMAALREGDLDVAAPNDPIRDEIGELSSVVAEATGRLRAARGSQERLIADAAHELRTPLTLVRTSVDVALRRRRTTAELEATLCDVRDEIDRVATLATRLLDVAAAGQGAWDRSPGDLRDVAHDSVEAAVATAEERGVLVQLVAAEPVPASYHAGSLRQAIDNLLSNALRFAPAKSTIQVRIAPLGGGGGVISVHDDGPGIPEAELERVFQPFRRAAPSPGSGAGLGLAIVREIAMKHGGRAYAARVPRGATVVIEIPSELRLRPPAVARA